MSLPFHFGREYTFNGCKLPVLLNQMQQKEHIDCKYQASTTKFGGKNF